MFHKFILKLVLLLIVGSQGCKKTPNEPDNSLSCIKSFPCNPVNISNAPVGKIVFSAVTEIAIKDSVWKNYYDQRQLFKINPDGSGLEQITNFNFEAYHLTLSPDGEKIAYSAWGEEGPGINTEYIYIYNIKDSSHIRMTDHFFTPQNMVWSPDSRKLAITECEDCEAFGNNTEIYILDVSSKQLERITTNIASDGPASWSPDGKEILFYSNRDDRINYKGDLYALNLLTKDLTRLTCSPESEYSPQWSPDGCNIVFSYQNAIYISNLQNLAERNIILKNTQSTPRAWSPGGDKILFLEGNGIDDFSLYKLDISTGKKELIFHTPFVNTFSIDYNEIKWIQ